MTLGIEQVQGNVFQGDSADLYAVFYDSDDTILAASDYASVSFIIRKPDGTDTTYSGTINSDGSLFYRSTDTTQLGVYKWVAQATLATGEVRSYRDEFLVTDPLEDPPVTQASEIGSEVWARLEDCFDSENGGPWLRDMTLAYFEPSKVERFIAEGLLRINIYPPASNLDLS
jgi:hypothetical protein